MSLKIYLLMYIIICIALLFYYMYTAEELQQAVEMWYNQLAVHGMRMSKVKTDVLEVSKKKRQDHDYRLWWMDSNYSKQQPSDTW